MGNVRIYTDQTKKLKSSVFYWLSYKLTFHSILANFCFKIAVLQKVVDDIICIHNM